MKIDLYKHVMPARYLDMLEAHSKDAGIVKRMRSLRMLWDIEVRVQMLNVKFPDVQQVLTLDLPSPALLGGPDFFRERARIANDGVAEMVEQWPKKFPALVASLPMNNVPAALEEMDRAVGSRSTPSARNCAMWPSKREASPAIGAMSRLNPQERLQVLG
jgi:aminocarboxymuconate-semialdehyde decarboxylase